MVSTGYAGFAGKLPLLGRVSARRECGLFLICQ